MKIHIKNMVCIRCKIIVEQQLKKMNLHAIKVELGEIEIIESVSHDQLKELDLNLKKYGLELLDDKKSILIGKIKNVIIALIHYQDEPEKINFSDHLSEN